MLTAGSSLLLTIVAPAVADHHGRPHWYEYNEAGLDPFLNRADRYLGDRTGEHWVDYAKKRPVIIVHTAVVDPTSRDRRVLNRLAPDGIRPDIVPVRYSYKEINEFAREASRIFDDFIRRKTFVGVAFNPMQNGVEIHLTRRDKKILRELRKNIPRDALVVKIGPAPRGGFLRGPSDRAGSTEQPKVTTITAVRPSSLLEETTAALAAGVALLVAATLMRSRSRMPRASRRVAAKV